MTKYKLGKKRAQVDRHSFAKARLLSDTLTQLGKPPAASEDWTVQVHKQMGSEHWGMMGNDQYGDCTCADSGHQLMLRTANTGTMVQPSTQDVLDLYTGITGFDPNDPSTDRGAVEMLVIRYLEVKGLLGHHVEAAANLNPKNLDHVKWTIQMYGACRIGVGLPTNAEEQFEDGHVWELVPGTGIEGGHDVPLVKYTPDGLLWCVTWDKLQPLTEEWYLAYVDEAHAELAGDFLLSTGLSPAGYDHQQMVAGLRQVGQG